MVSLLRRLKNKFYVTTKVNKIKIKFHINSVRFKLINVDLKRKKEIKKKGWELKLKSTKFIKHKKCKVKKVSC